MRARFLSLPALLCAAVLLAGCAGVKVGSISPAEYLAQRRGDVLTTGRLSTSAEEVLRVIGSDADLCRKDGQACRNALADSSGLSDEQRLSALSEVWLQVALAAEKGGTATDATAIEAWFETARHAYAYLFFTARKPRDRAFEDRQTQVRDYYNYAVQQAITGLFHGIRRNGSRNATQPEMPKVGDWRIETDVSGLRLPADTPLPDELIPAASLTFSGLRNTYRRDGFGAELVAADSKRTDDEAPRIDPAAPADQADKRPPYREMPFPAVTALLLFDGASLAEVLNTRTLRIAAYDPYRTANAQLAGQEVPLAANFTSGYGLWLARSDFALQALRSLFGGRDGLTQPRIYLMQPYDPNRRTVIMLHGLASSPEAWINVANEVLGDETLRRRYQIWQVYYPTNAPLPINNFAIREAVTQTLAHFDPTGKAPASNNITLIGHSMGGVLSRLMVSSSEDKLWDALLASYPMQGAQQRRMEEKLAPYLRFEPLPQVSDAIFIASPHRGTDFANNRISRWVANLITLPVAMLGQLSDISRELIRIAPARQDQGTLRIPNSIDNLSDRDPFVRLSSGLPMNPRVRFHSIIGNDTPGVAQALSSDGIVPYESAHLDGAASELVIPSAHSVQENPLAILEIRRILREQLRTEPGPAR
ncbi:MULTISPECIES: alpha/beta fold hydrolase [unclassified Variovorax]|jgi:triacylglycerol esterase/lipase EstA (alpha/beta hydrolase family)|uniref:esterase/lipase family protein n=1 Tax=unclassified Variovorax TaxID=663243 RepID=UPI000F7EF789|nr:MULTISPECIES: alpha/beta fold hydrolase [unclassified Variovorax]RSZ37232.1 alpha/beta hydrolase [Variovorax sp. 553]RSZ38046.1 alpha/beta hydrolase [Variovorax sp. 679]